MSGTQEFIAIMYGLSLGFLLWMFYIGRTYKKDDEDPD